MAKIRPVLPYILFLLLAALILDAGNPLFDRPARDGGFFLYAGNQILSGKIPYLDFWDSKGPAIFYINALGLFLGRGSRWGVWGLEFVFIFAWLSVLYKTVGQAFSLTPFENKGSGGLQTRPTEDHSKKWGESAAIFGVIMATFGLRIVFGYGNYTEEYALLFNALGLYLFFALMDSEDSSRGWKYFWVGALFGVSFSFRANNIGGLFGILLALFVKGIADFSPQVLGKSRTDASTKLSTSVRAPNGSKAVETILIILAGFIMPLLLWTLYFQIWGAAQEMIYASIIFNFSYASAKSREFLDFFGGFGRYGMSWVGWFAAFGYLVYSYGVVRKILQRKPVSMMDIFLLLWFPIEIFLSNLSGRNFSHYYIGWALAVAVYGAVIYASAEPYILELQFSGKLKQGIFFLLILGLFVLSPSSIIRYGDTFYKLLFNRNEGLEYSDPLSEYIQENTQRNDLVLTWYPEMAINFMSQRTSPVRLVYYPLFLAGTLTAEAENNYIDDLTNRRPAMIVDCSLAVNAIPSLDPQAREEQFSKPGVKKKMYLHPGMERIFFFVSENYHLETSINGCFVFRLNLE